MASDAGVKPVIVAHSFGGLPTLACAARHGERLRAAVIVDTPLRSPEQRAERDRNKVPRMPRDTRVYASVAA
jgi:pimeloyl-ACP methyl ester carboxylesterase